MVRFCQRFFWRRNTLKGAHVNKLRSSPETRLEGVLKHLLVAQATSTSGQIACTEIQFCDFPISAEVESIHKLVGIQSSSLTGNCLLELVETFGKEAFFPLCLCRYRTLSFSQQQLSTVLSSHLVDITDLVNIRYTLLSILPTSDHGNDSGSASHLLGGRVDLWTNLFQPPFLQHLEVGSG